MVSKMMSWALSFAAMLPFAACGDASRDIATPTETPNLPTLTEYRGPDGRVTDVTLSEDISLPFRVVVKDVDGKTIHERIVREFPPTEPEPLTDEEEAMARAILEARASTDLLAAQLLAELNEESR